MRASLVLLGTLLLAAAAPFASTDPSRPGGLPGDIDPGELTVLRIDGKTPDEPLELPLRHTDVRISVTGFVARATVTQHYSNPFEAPIEAVYVFPLPDQAAVDGMTMQIGEKVIRGEIKRRDEAREIYEQAKAQGKRTGLLEQERPNIFTQSVGNIMPGDDIRVEITYVDILDFRDEGSYELVFPMVVGPRYIPGSPTDKGAGGKPGGGWAPDTDQVPDASRITPPVLEPGQRSGHDISLEVALDAAVKIHGVHSVSHAVDITEVSESERRVRLHPSDTIPNKDFVLRYQVAGKAPAMAFITHHTQEHGGYFTFIALPPRQVSADDTVARDLIFILDTSGSMSGFPMDKSKQAMEKLIDGMRPSDRFNVVRFAGDTGTLWPEPRPKTAENVRAAKQFVAALRASGGTEMRQGITEALAQPSDPQRLRIAFLLTDGYVGNEEAIFTSIEKERRSARVFALGVGSSVNRYLLDRAATIGRGEVFYVRQDEDAGAVIERFFQRVDRPSLAHVEIDWNGLEVYDLTPARVPDLWQGQPILVHGRYRTGGEAQVTVRGLLGRQPYTWPIRVALPENEPENALMATVWARAKVKELMLEMGRGGDRGKLTEQITELGLEYDILTQWTSFVAVEEKVVNEGGERKTIVQPVELPEGVDYTGVFGEPAEAMQPQGYPARMYKGSRAVPAPMSAPTYAQPLLEGKGRGVADAWVGAGAAVQEEEEAKAASVTARCRFDALSVSGGLKYPEVDRILRATAWDDLCRSVQGRYSGRLQIAVELTVAADGSVTRVSVTRPDGVPEDLRDTLRDGFKRFQFGAVAGGGTARIRLKLVLM